MKITSTLTALLLMALAPSAGLASGADWMASLPDDARLRQLSIPGAHDAATGNGFTSGSSFLASISGITQTLSIQEQWDAGVRAFDLRPAYKDGGLPIFHGILETKISLRDALTALVAKLEENPGEFAVIVMHHEDDSDSGVAEWPEAVASLMQEFDSRLVAFSPSLTVGAARGKILVLSRDRFTSSKSAMINGWNHNENFADQQSATIALGRQQGKLFVQDFYECGTAERKVASMTAMLDYSTSNTAATNWVINHSSGYIGSMGTNSNIEALAAVTNAAMADYLEAGHEGRAGIVLMDFAGVDTKGSREVSGARLVNTLIEHNKKYLDYSAVSDVAVDSGDDADAPVYNLSGICVGRGRRSLSTLPPGIYILSGQKIKIK